MSFSVLFCDRKRICIFAKRNNEEMKNIDISILKEEPSLDMKAKLIIEPLAPLSIVSDLPGAYYKSKKMPSKKMLCGLIENVLGWHFSAKTRILILNQIKQHRGKINDYESGSTYKPLLMDYFELGDNPIIKFDSMCIYDDLWARSHSRRDSPREHIKRCRHFDSPMSSAWDYELESIENNQDIEEERKKKERNIVNKKFITHFPFYYPALPSKREYIAMDNGSYLYNVVFDNKLYVKFKEQLVKHNIAYIGNSEGWVNIILEEL